MRHPLNVEGSWFVSISDSDESCIGCGVCYSDNPEFFGDDDSGIAYMKKQPSSFEEVELCNEQKDACPASAINSGSIDERL
jgi:ferredoxin